MSGSASEKAFVRVTISASRPLMDECPNPQWNNHDTILSWSAEALPAAEVLLIEDMIRFLLQDRPTGSFMPRSGSAVQTVRELEAQSILQRKKP